MDVVQLKRIPLFQSASDEDLKIVATFAKDKEVPEGTVLMKEGGFSNELMAIEEGEAEVLKDGEKVADLGPGDFFGEAGLLEKTPRNASVVAKTRVKVIMIERWEIPRMKKKSPQIVEELRKTLEERGAGVGD